MTGQRCDERKAARGEPEERLKEAIQQAAHLLPAQGPITVFIHHNTLHAFEELPFGEAVQRGAKTFGCQPYLSLDRYREELARGRIRLADLVAVLMAKLGEQAGERVLKSHTRLDLRLAMLQHPLRYGPTEELLWFVAETDALRRVRSDVSEVVRRRLIAETRRWVMRDLRGQREVEANGSPMPAAQNGRKTRATSVAALIERFGDSRIESWSDEAWESFMLRAMWRVCREGVSGIPELSLPPMLPVRHRDLLLLVTGTDTDAWVHELLIRFSGAFLDQGLARWRLPKRELGFYRAFCALYRQQGGAPDRWRRGLPAQLGRLEDEGIQPLDSILESLAALGVEEFEWHEFLAATLLALRGWTGMVRFLEERPDRAVQPVPSGSLIELVAIRLVLDRVAAEFAARETLGYTGPLTELRADLRRRIGPAPPPSDKQRAFVVFQLAQVLGLAPEELHRLSREEWGNLLEEIDAFSPIERRSVFHLAYEHRFHTQTLDALALHEREFPDSGEPNELCKPDSPRKPPSFQAMFCIDEREESLRRHLEEVAPAVETFSIAGFYFVDMYYRGAGDAHYVPLCPVVIRPKHWVTERVDESLAPAHERRAKTRRALGLASHHIHIGSRTFALGALLSAVAGVLATAPLIARTLFPRLTARIRQAMGQIVVAPPKTRLQIEHSDAAVGASNGHVGFTLEEMVGSAERVLRDTGLTSHFSRLVLTIGHGSTSMNNPHESAHDCGACGGGRGGPNARAIAQMLNDGRVRERLKARGLVIGAETVFVGGMHNTSDETIVFYDLDLLPETHRGEFEAARSRMEEACNRDAHERCRRFESAPLTLSCAAARKHVEGRAEDLAQVRPEWGHATNAICIVGRRERTRGLFLDRRAFLNSYDPTKDDAEGTILARILQAAVPVCAGISLEYYFSYVDNAGYGSGTKLPHNIASLVGVMDGAGSDLRTGLPWQMVEIHEPMRILFVIETTPETMRRVVDRNAEIKRLVENEWVLLATLDPHSSAVHRYRDGDFHLYEPVAEELPRAASSADWYRGWRDHLEFAEIGPA